MNFRKQKRPSPLGEINVTPLVDMVFILLIFLLLSTTFRSPEKSFVVDLPVAGTEGSETTPSSTVVFIKESGDYFLLKEQTQKVEPVTLEQLHQHLAELKTKKEEPLISIRGEQDANLQSLIKVIDLIHTVGLTQIELPYEMETKEETIEN